jgi:hypothetical protein
VEWVARQAGVSFVIHYLDNFLLIEAPDSPECAKALETLLEIFRRLGLPVAVKKREGPSTCLGFLGFELDSRLMEVRLPRQKLEELKALEDTGYSRIPQIMHILRCLFFIRARFPPSPATLPARIALSLSLHPGS